LPLGTPRILNKLSTYAAVKDLVIAYFEAVREDPFRAQSFASALVTICNSPGTPTFEQETLFDILADELAGMHFKYYDSSNMANELGPTNEHLVIQILCDHCHDLEAKVTVVGS